MTDQRAPGIPVRRSAGTSWRRTRVKATDRPWMRPSFRALARRRDPVVLKVTLQESLGLMPSARSRQEHLEAGMRWLAAAQDAVDGGGVSAYFDLDAGTWAPPYPETTGYIIPTFFDYADSRTDAAPYRERAVRMADWLLGVQLEDGAFPMGPLWPWLERRPLVFDTGQILFGLERTYRETGETRYKDAALAAARWLARTQESSGTWRRHEFLEQEHAYNARTAWGLLMVAPLDASGLVEQAARRQLAWSLAEQTANGWFAHAGFRPEDEPLTHTLAYTIRGLLESGDRLGEPDWVAAAARAARALLACQARDGVLLGTYDAAWRSSASWSCLTGTAQMSLIWLRLFQMTGDRAFLDGALTANDFVTRAQSIAAPTSMAGGVAGSYPIHGEYHPFLYVNWAAKFLVDSLLLEHHLREGEPKDEPCEHHSADVQRRQVPRRVDPELPGPDA